MPQVGAELELMVAEDLCPVVHVLVALFLLDQRAVTTCNVEGFTQVPKPAAAARNSIEKQAGQPVRCYVRGIQTGKAQSGGRISAVLIELRRVRIVAKESKAEIRQERVA